MVGFGQTLIDFDGTRKHACGDETSTRPVEHGPARY
jgi:hypothetical protein